MSYKELNPDFEKRKAEAAAIIEQHPNSLPYICEKSANCDLPEINKKEWILPKDLFAY